MTLGITLTFSDKKNVSGTIQVENDSYNYKFSVIPKPDEIFIKDEIIHYTYGKKRFLG